jgi:hypothetical protein
VVASKLPVLVYGDAGYGEYNSPDIEHEARHDGIDGLGHARGTKVRRLR